MPSQDDKINWLHNEIERWTREGVIDSSHAQSIKNLYPSPQAKKSTPWALIVFSGIGAVIIGLGIILLFAYNWDKMSKYSKLSVVFGSLILAHSAGIATYTRSERFKGIGEALCLLGSMLFGAGIWLIAQIYHINEHYPNAFLYWGIGAMLMAWTMPSVIQAILAAVLFTIYSACEGVDFNSSIPLALVLLAALLPIAYNKRSRVLITILLLGFSISLIFVSSSYQHQTAFPVLLGIFSFFTAVGLIHQKSVKYELFSPYYFFIGLAGYLISLYILGFEEVLNEILEIDKLFDTGLLLYWFVPSVIAFVCWVYIAKKFFKKENIRYFSPDYFLIPLIPFFLFYCTFSINKYFPLPSSAALNLIFLAHVVMMMGRGCMNAQLLPTIFGSLLLIALMIARFIDFVDNLAIRGVIFVVVGILIFSQGFFYVRTKRKKAMQENK